MKNELNIALVGQGAIAQYVIEQLADTIGVNIVGIVSREASVEKAQALANGRFPVVTRVEMISTGLDVLVDCAGHEGLIAHVPGALANGVDVISISTGALAQEGLAETLEQQARAGHASIRFLSGAVGGIDVLSAAAVGEFEQITYTGRKPPSGWRGSKAEEVCDLSELAEPFEHFVGTAREAASLYPKNANVAATIALASLGLDNVAVKLIADPGVDKNIHEVSATGAFGSLFVRIEGNPLPGNPKSSALAAMSIVAELNRRVSRVQI